jgi:hypothetical protein
MGGPRALFASIGASVSLVAAAALSLLAVSAVFAFGGWSEPLTRSASRPALVFAESTPAKHRDAKSPQIAAAAAASLPIIAPASVRRTEWRAERRAKAPAVSPVRSPPPRTGESAKDATATPDGSAPAVAPAPATPPAPPVNDNVGDHVRKLGVALSSTVQSTGSALANATQPLAPPVSVAVQQVLNLVADIVRRATDGLGTTLNGLLAPK